MTPKEKAIVLYLKFKQRTYYVEVLHTDILLDKFHNNAISSAEIAVDEILNMINKNYVDVWDIDILKFWKEVKQELQKWKL